MRFEFDGQQYAIVFQYDWSIVDDQLEKRQHRQMTRSMLFKLPYAKGDEPFAQATVYRHFKDKNSKETARKAALKKMLEIFPSKEFHHAAWQAYLNRKEGVVSNKAIQSKAS